MPNQVELEPGLQCSFFSFCVLDDLQALQDDDDAQIVDVWVDASTLTRFNHTTTVATSSATSVVSRPEQFFFPSSVAFDFLVSYLIKLFLRH
jgi:hypothetical protein